MPGRVSWYSRKFGPLLTLHRIVALGRADQHTSRITGFVPDDSPPGGLCILVQYRPERRAVKQSSAVEMQDEDWRIRCRSADLSSVASSFGKLKLVHPQPPKFGRYGRLLGAGFRREKTFPAPCCSSMPRTCRANHRDLE